MEIRPVGPGDVDALIEIDATIQSPQYLHIERSGEGLAMQWKVQERPRRAPLVDRNRPSDELQFLVKQIATGADEGLALLAEHDGAMVAMLLAQAQPDYGTMRVIDVRVDSDYRRQGLATTMIYQVIAEARSRELRAAAAEVRADNVPACRLFAKLGFELAGLDTQRHSNHDLVKEAGTLFWYAALN